ncbi:MULTISPECIES: cupin domain-containing protein [unclassified Arcicella]|uniref:cupin domain-containing protein n=1 Tax=unclassified Arcicella TaxID=2644986 RepID=UPI002865DA9C|nr:MULTISPECIES: cupin domain-containing protein [unclassified Arcicella]MDR6562483.1 quercetin dioxygenase-like cupin family protein [Arcicella sp. BE51]MDR6812570.1 quercetin dioxygenase-like cupin family protein [Arcicella sp. BE140]MDR6823882.1 quercetin dioxygenase-like cupin family protein [Arcicella sp. BE139]
MLSVKELTLVSDEQVAWEELGGGIKRKVMSYNDDIMLVKVAFEQGGVGAIHSHPHLQISYVSAGAFEITIGEDKKILKTGDVYFVPSDILHGAVCLEAGELIDVFSPMRADFV